jgi:predicted Zn-dependent peptidase
MVLGSQTATDVSAGQDSRKWAGCFEISAEAREGKTPADVENAIYAELDKLKTNSVPAEELQKVKNNFAAHQYRRLSDNMSILMQVLGYEGYGNWRDVNEAAPKIQAVTAADIQRVANLYFTKENRSVATYTRKNEPAALTSASAQAKEQK